MTQLIINGRIFPARLIAFDKDGTLVNFHHLWGSKTQHWVETMVATVGGDDTLRAALYRTLGFAIEENRVMSEGPVAVASNPKIYAVATAVLYQYGLSWHHAEAVAQDTGKALFGVLPTADLVKPMGDVAGTFKRLAQAGLRLAIITSDDRAATEKTLSLLGITDLVEMLVCGDDPLPNKPDPAALWHVGQQLDIDPAQMLMVGDTESDMVFGRKAGVAGCVGVVGGAGDEKLLAETADVLISSIEAIQIRNGV